MESAINKKLKEVRLKIRTQRVLKEYSQEYVGVQLGIGQVAYHKLERNKTKLSLDVLLKLAIVLEVDATYFLEK